MGSTRVSTAKLAVLLAGLSAIASTAGGCAIQGVDLETETTEADDPALQPPRRVLLCQQGLSDRTTGWDKGLFALCEAAEKEGFTLVRDGDYPAFGALDENGAYAALFDELDENGDGVVDVYDSIGAVHLVGFSWGGINVTDIADRLRKDERILSSRRGVAAMVLLDPYQPTRWRAPVPANVAFAWEYRQSYTSDNDCSHDVSLGLGFNGLTPLAKSAATSCTVYDLDAFAGKVGHCDVPSVATQAALANLLELRDYEPWADYAADCPLK
ncbi:MAG: hypothetical protein HOW73_40070 [Polyangiaceae bacterium]|nr:hypothetical protein [Polyangiaceae bacterium]